MRKPMNLRGVKIDDNGFSGSNPYVCFFSNREPVRVTLDGEFGVADLEWILNSMKRMTNADKGNDKREV
jgi:hypothetical protein